MRDAVVGEVNVKEKHHVMKNLLRVLLRPAMSYSLARVSIVLRRLRVQERSQEAA